MEKKRIVVKIGSSSLTNDRGEIDQEKYDDHVQALAKLRNKKGMKYYWSLLER